MKQYIILIGAIIVVIAIHIFQCSYLEKTSRYILTDLSDIEGAVKRDDFNRAIESSKELESTWKSIKPGWDSFGEHDDIGDIENDIESLIIYVEEKEKTDTLEKISSIEFRLKHVIESERLKMHNVL